jgi:hypothetical protein
MTTQNVYQIRDGVFALGTAGRKARAVVRYDAKTKAYIGVRGVKPTIDKDAKTKTVAKAALEKLQALAN